MNCAEVQQVLPEMSEGGENIEYQAHLKSCPECSELVSDLELIASASRQLADVDEPPQRVWVKIAAELRAEGIIREPESEPARPVLVPSAGRRWNAWWLVPVAAALVVAGSYVIKPKPAAPVARQDAPATISSPPQASAPAQVAADTKSHQPVAASNPSKSTDSVGPDDHAPMMTASTADQKFLEQVSPEMRLAYEGQLRTVNSYIRDAENYLKQNPGDEDARQHLMEAYEQKEMLYQMALDRVQ
jgi:hypothetical protein